MTEIDSLQETMDGAARAAVEYAEHEYGIALDYTEARAVVRRSERAAGGTGDSTG